MQHPTCTNIRIRSTRDAHIIFHAVSLGYLKAITRRLDADERAALQSGCVYAWEERGPHTEVTGLGIERFTEGRRWGPSRVRDEFLFYYEKHPPTHLREKDVPSLDEIRRKHWDPLVKQTYSVWVDGPRGRRKWHLTAYFTQATVDRLQTVDDMPELASLEVPQGKYISTRLGKPRRMDDGSGSPAVHDVFRPANMSAARTYAPFPLPYAVTPPHHLHQDSNSIQAQSHVIHPCGFDYTHPRPDQPEPPRHFYGSTPAHHPRFPNSPLTLPPIHALDSNNGSQVTDNRQTWSASHDNSANGDGVSHHSGHLYASYNQPGADQHSPMQRPTYYPPTPTSSSSQNESPLYPSPVSGLPPSEHAHQLPTQFPLREAYPSPYPSPPTRYPPMPPAQSYPDTHSCHFSGYHINANQGTPPNTMAGHSPTMFTSPNHTAETQPPQTQYDSFDREFTPSQVPQVSQYYTTENVPTSAPSPLHQHPGSTISPRRPTVTLSVPQDHRPSPPMSEVHDDGTASPQLSPRSTGSASNKRLLDLAPLRSLQRTHPYRRDKFDDRALSLLNSHR